MRKHYHRGLLYPTVVLVFVANTVNLGVDLGGMAAALRLLLPALPFALIIFAFGGLILLLEVLMPYRQYARVLKALTLALLAYVVTAFVIRPQWGALLQATLLPTIQPNRTFLFLVVGLLGTTISPYLFFWQASEEVEEVQDLNAQDATSRTTNSAAARRRRQRNRTRGQLKRLQVDTAIGMLASEGVAWFIMVTASETLFVHHVNNITSADQAAAALGPLVHSFAHAGQLAQLIFALGIVSAGLLAVPTLAGSAAYAVAEAFTWREG